MVCGRDEILSEDEKKLDTRKILENRAESHKSTARFVGQPANQNAGWKKKPPLTWQDFTRNFDFYQSQKTVTYKTLAEKRLCQTNQNADFGKPILPKMEKANESDKILQT